ncbi:MULTISPECIES: pyridoxamine 5'-phosphate oxidase family protein [Enterococcus]|uniref:Pyridoxamine 5'-phosphate oxidase family protein n=1 Tax=Enterococcus alishanensis TaxID=1303817 RepID=A0ABS6TB22_9ENTE|nr:pyridoxamine 5'-phosphate oxidase family protein [Enterococcus alishanensis]MBV7390090.1 pyridoxamine 5'-phosphate oxidase family protein [Enterococcus alishanensis]
MKKKKRQVTDLETIKEFVAETQVARLAFFDEEYPYIVPVNFAEKWQEDQLILYIHGAKDGKKIDLIKKNPKVAIEMDGKHELIATGRNAAGYSYAYQSLIGFGEVEIIEELAEKRQALEDLMAHAAPMAEYDEIPEKMIKITGILKITLNSYTMKQNPPKKTSN